MARRRAWWVLQFAAGALLVGLAARSILVNWQSLRAQPIEWQFSQGWIAASVLLVFASYTVLIEAWRRVVLSMGQRLAFLPAARIWFLSSLGKYVPGEGLDGRWRGGFGPACRSGSCGGRQRRDRAPGAGAREWCGRGHDNGT